MEERITEIKQEIRELFRINNLEDGLIHSAILNYMEGKLTHEPYIDKRVSFHGLRKFNKLVKEFKEINRKAE